MNRLLPALLALVPLLWPPPSLGGWGTGSVAPVGAMDPQAMPAFSAKHQTQNFVIDAPSAAFAAQVGEAAEAARKKWAVAWLGYELPAWRTRCQVRVTVTQQGAGGATTFNFTDAGLAGMSMHVEGPANRILESVLPHEVTHTVFATYLQRPIPRWADEGGAVCSEDDGEKCRHDQLCRSILNTPGRAIPLARLFGMQEYPKDVMALYAEGYSVTNWLIGLKGRPAFLGFVWHGMQAGRGWDEAARTSYGYDNVNALEKAWLQHLRDTKKQPGAAAPPFPTPPPPTLPVASSPAAPDDRIMTTLDAVNRKLDDLLTVKADVVDLKKRMAGEEADVADLKRRLAVAEADLSRLKGTPSAPQTSLPPAWNNPPQDQPMRPIPRTTQPPSYAQPVAAPPSAPYLQPYCPDGRCPR